MNKRIRIRRIVKSDEPSEIARFRAEYVKKGFELVDITHLMEWRLGDSGWINGLNEPVDSCYHVQGWYRGENIAVFQGRSAYVIDDKRFVMFVSASDDDSDVIIFRKVKV